MAFDYWNVVRTSFENIGPRNPLKKLNDYDKRILVSLLKVYASMPQNGEFYELLDEAAGVAADAGALATRMRSKVFQGPLAEMVAPFLSSLKDLPQRLLYFSRQLGTLLDQTCGKRGHKGKTGKNVLLIMASEFVRLKTGKHNDEHLAELLQAVDPGIGVNENADISGDAIRKKREHLKKVYRLLYYDTVNRVHDFAQKKLTT